MRCGCRDERRAGFPRPDPELVAVGGPTPKPDRLSSGCEATTNGGDRSAYQQHSPADGGGSYLSRPFSVGNAHFLTPMPVGLGESLRGPASCRRVGFDRLRRGLLSQPSQQFSNRIISPSHTRRNTLRNGFSMARDTPRKSNKPAYSRSIRCYENPAANARDQSQRSARILEVRSASPGCSCSHKDTARTRRPRAQ